MSEENGAGKQIELLPLANIVRVMKSILPPEAKVSKEARALVREKVSLMISFVVCEALDRNELDGRRTVSGDDIIDSLRALGFDSTYTDCLGEFLRNFRSQKKSLKRPLPAEEEEEGENDEDSEED